MAEKVKKISINAFEKAIKENYLPTETIDWNGLSIIIKRNLGLRDMLAFVDDVVKNCFNDDGTFMPEVRDFATRSNIIDFYTNISLPRNVESRYDLLYHSCVVDDVLENIDRTQFGAMIKAIDEKISNTAHANIQAIYTKINDVYASFENLEQQLEKTFGGVDGDAVNALLGVLGDGVDEEKIVKAVLSTQDKQE